MSGRHADEPTTSRRSFALLTGATVLGLWFGLRAPDVTPVALPPPAGMVQPAEQTQSPPDVSIAPVVPSTPVVPRQADGRGPGRGGR